MTYNPNPNKIRRDTAPPPAADYTWRYMVLKGTLAGVVFDITAFEVQAATKHLRGLLEAEGYTNWQLRQSHDPTISTPVLLP